MHRDSVRYVFRQADSLKYKQQYHHAAKAFKAVLVQTLPIRDRSYALNQLALCQLHLRQDTVAAQTLALLSTESKNIAPADPYIEADFSFNQGLLAERRIQPDSAFHFFRRAYGRYQHLYPGDHLKKAQCLNFLAGLQIEYALVYDSVTFSVLQARDAFRPSALAPYQKECLLLQAYLARTKRNHALGESLCDQALKLAEAPEVWQDTFFLAECHSEKGMQIKKQENLAEAEKHLKQAVALTEGYPKYYRRQYFYQNLLQCYIKMAKTSGAQLFPATLDNLKTLVRAQGRDYYALPERLEGFFAYYQGNYPQLIACYQRAQEKLTPKYPNYWHLSEEANYMLGHGYRKTQNFEKALYYEREMFKAGTPFAGQPLSEAEMMKPAVYQYVTNPYASFSQMGEIYLERYQIYKEKADLERANRFYELTDSLMTADLLNKEEAQIQTFQSELGDGNYGGAIRAAYLLYQNGDGAKAMDLAFRYIERQKSLVLYRDLIRQSLSEDPGWKVLVDSLNQVDTEIRYLEWCKQRENGNPASRSLYSSRLGQVQYKRQAFLEQAKRQYPQVSNTANIQIIPSVATIIAQLADTQAVLQYSLRDAEQGYVLCLSKKGARFAAFKCDTVFNNHARRYLHALSQRSGTLQSTLTEYRTSATWLYVQLVKPFEDLLPRKGGELIVIPDKTLHQLPFEAFLTRLEAMDKRLPFYKNAAYLAREMTVVVSPSWKVRGHRAPTGAPIKNVVAYTYGDTKSPLGLHAWEAELGAIRDHFKLSQRSDKNCKSQDFMRDAFSYEAIHLLLHGQSSRGIRRDNKLYFGIQSDIMGKAILVDTLYGFQIGARTNKTRLAVLSACETALGDDQSGEGAYTLTRCFLQAGVSEVVASMWAIDDAASAQLMGYFYGRLQSGGTAAHALHRAKLDYLQAAPSGDCFPGYWAGLCAFN